MTKFSGKSQAKEKIKIKNYGMVSYAKSLKAMQEFTLNRKPNTADELWVLEHHKTYTLGVASKPEHLPIKDTKINIYKSDRGGQITYHGPGQLIVYTLLDLKRRQTSIRSLIRILENSVIHILKNHGVKATGSESQPGVYVDDAKIASLGLRIKNGCCYHGLSLNIDMDLDPFYWINPCGIKGLNVTQLADLGIYDDIETVSKNLLDELCRVL